MTHKKQQALEIMIEEWNNRLKESSFENNSCVDKAVGESGDRSWANLQSKLQGTVVQVFAQVAQINWLQPYMTPAQGGAAGTGFFIDKDGYFITNGHVVADVKAIGVQIPAFGRERFDAVVVGVSFDRDIALLKLGSDGVERLREKFGDVPCLKLGDSNKIRRGEELMTLGYPLGQEYLKSTVGIVSGRESLNSRQYIQIDAPINHGSSGGPSLDREGFVIGVNTAGVPDAQNIGYIIPINELSIILKELYQLENAENKLLRKPYLGFFYNAASPALNAYLGNPSGGVYITEVYKGSIVEKAGAKKGDVLYEFDGRKIDGFGQLSVPWCEDKISVESYTFYLRHGQEISFGVYREGESKKFSLKFEHSELPPIRTRYPDYEKIEYEVVGGMVIMELTKNHLPIMLNAAPQLILYGESKNQLKPVLVITHIIPDSVAQRSRVLAPGLRLKEINDEKVRTLSELRKAVRKGSQKSFLKVRTLDGFVAAFSMDQILRDEPRLSAIYRYQISPTIKELMVMKQYENQKKARSISPIKLPQLKQN